MADADDVVTDELSDGLVEVLAVRGLGRSVGEEVVRPRQPLRVVQVDGDVVGKAIALRATIRKDALQVRVPKKRTLMGPAV